MTTALWLTLRYRDPDAALSWLRSLGFVERAVHRSPDPPHAVVHAELDAPGGGGLMLGPVRDNPDWPQRSGTGAAYLVVDDLDAVYVAAVEAGGRPLLAPREQDYGGRTATVADPEGNLWSLGTYRP
ncbi:putative glyoxalase superfamily protein PhnB [Isoptericola jiangsuensis]|uniref:Putative glyoxalase superfamily protein PhnB n=1 Tax=Isoptericola jiangsuensis TaxID=548579 RepID=A0A2A9EYS3_9MICO|nr:VOC family protein [Isoptericola jiangsuensis]PFG43380.1 putative glyoxalase superfamily protein PhnB [Isoptericola jiangsuensis]